MDLSVEETGLDVQDLRCDHAFAERPLRTRGEAEQRRGVQRLTTALFETPSVVLQELVNTAVELCGADSAGISVEKDGGSDDEYWEWIATAGVYSPFLGAVLPRFPSACSVCLLRDHAQHFTVSKKFFDILGVNAPTITDGLLLPWHTDGTRGTIFVMAHGRTDAFDKGDVQLMGMLAELAASGVRLQKQHARTAVEQHAHGAAQMAHELAHNINNPLQSITNISYLLTSSPEPWEPPSMATELA